MAKKSGIHIKPSKKGTFTAAAKKRGMGVQEFASKVMANKEDYSSAMVKKANFAKNAAKWKKAQGSAEVVAANKLGCPGGDCREGSPLENVFVNVLNLKTLPKAGDLGGNEFADWSRKDYREEWERMVNPFIYSDYGEGMQNIPSQADYDKFRGEFMQTHPDLFVPTIKGMGGEGRFKLTPENQYDIAMKAYYAARNPGMKRVGTPYLKASGRDPQNLGFEDVVRDFSSAGWENAANWMYTSPYSATSFPKKQAVAKKEAGGKMPKAYAQARFRAAGNEDMLGDYGYAKYGADIEPFVYHGYNDNTGNWKDPGLKKRWAAEGGGELNPLPADYYPLGDEDVRPLPGEFPVANEDMEALPEKAGGGGIPQRYKNMGFTRVGQKKAGSGKHKWKVLAKKGDQYKVVQGGWRGMQDFKQHGSEKRRDKFWSRMGGKNSAKAKDPFSPLYWHKRFGTWQEGGEVPDNPGFNALPEAVQQKIIDNMEAGGKMPPAYAKARFEAAGNEHLLKQYGYAKSGASIPNNPGFKALPPHVQQKIMGNVKKAQAGIEWDDVQQKLGGYEPLDMNAGLGQPLVDDVNLGPLTPTFTGEPVPGVDAPMARPTRQPTTPSLQELGQQRGITDVQRMDQDWEPGVGAPGPFSGFNLQRLPEVASPAQTIDPTQRQFLDPSANITQEAKANAQKVMENAKREKGAKTRKKVASGIVYGASFVNSLLRDQEPRVYRKAEYDQYYNPFPAGVPSQALSQSGGTYISGSGIKFQQAGTVSREDERKQRQESMQRAKERRPYLRSFYEKEPVTMFTEDPEAQAAYSKELAESMESGRQWLQDWYAKRAQLPQFKTVAGARARDLSRPQPYFMVPENLMDPNTAGSTLSRAALAPMMFPGYGENPSYTAPYVALHEMTHRQDVRYPQLFLGKKGRERRETLEMPTSEQTGMDMSKLQWLEGDTEPNAVLSWWRKENKIDPTKEITADEVSKMMKYYESLPARGEMSEEERKKSWKDRKGYQKSHGDYHIKALWERFGKDAQKFADYHNQTVMNTSMMGEEEMMAKAGGMIKRADGSYSKRGLWDNIRAAAARNKRTGAKPKKPTAEMLRQERKIKAQEAEAGMNVTGLYYPRGGEISNVFSDSMPMARMGGNIRRNYVSEYEQGGELEFYDDRAGAQPIGDNPYSPGPIVKFTPEDQSHAKGGIPMAWGGTQVEVEGNETGRKDKNGNFKVWGNMYNPLTGNKFKKDGEMLAKATEKVKNKAMKGASLVDKSDPDNPFEMLTFNTGRAKMMGADMQLKNLDAATDYFEMLQDGKLALAEQLGIEPMRMDAKNKKTKIAKMGGTIKRKAQAADTLPGYMTEASMKTGQQEEDYTYPYVTDTGKVIDTKPSGIMQPDTSVAGLPEYLTEADLKGAYGDLSLNGPGLLESMMIINSLKQGTDVTQRQIRNMVGTVEQSPEEKQKEEEKQKSPYYSLERYNYNTSPESDVEPFNMTNILGEVYALATNRVGPTFFQKIAPRLLQDYTISFKNRLAENDRSYRSALMAARRNPAAQSELFSRKLDADAKVLSDEFIANQAIKQEIINKNTEMINQARAVDLQNAKRQFDEWQRSVANTRKRTFDALSSIGTKKLLHEKSMNALRVLENMYNYRFGPEYRATYVGIHPKLNIPAKWVPDPQTGGYKVIDPKTGQRLPDSPVPQIEQYPGEATNKPVKPEGKKAGGSIMREFKRYNY